MNWHQKSRIGLPREVRLLGFLRKKQEEILDMFSEYSGCIVKHLTGLCVHPTFQLTYLNSQGKRETTGTAACAADIALLDFKAFMEIKLRKASVCCPHWKSRNTCVLRDSMKTFCSSLVVELSYHWNKDSKILEDRFIIFCIYST